MTPPRIAPPKPPRFAHLKPPRTAHHKPTTRPWSEPPLELSTADLQSVPPVRGDLGLDLPIEFESDVAPVLAPPDGPFGSMVAAERGPFWGALVPKLVAFGRARARWIAAGAIVGVGALASWLILPLMGRSPSGPSDPAEARAALVSADRPNPLPERNIRNEAASEPVDEPAVTPPSPVQPVTPAHPRPAGPSASRGAGAAAPAVASRTTAVASLRESSPKRTPTPAPSTPTHEAQVAPPPERPRPASPSSSLPDVDVAAEFDRSAAMATLRQAGDRAKSCGGSAGTSFRVSVTFARTGHVSDAHVDGSGAGTPAAACVAGRFRGLQVPPFRGSSITVFKTVIF